MDDDAVTEKRVPLDWDAVEEAFGALQPFYDPEDDGDGVRLSLDAIASVLADATGRDLEGDEPLSSLLEELKAPSDLQEMIDELYEAAEGGSYGEGMSKEQAEKVNSLVQDIYDPLHLFLKKAARAPRRRASLDRKAKTLKTTSKKKKGSGKRRAGSKGTHAS